MVMQSSTSQAVRLRFYLPPEDLRPFVTTIYQMVINAPPEDPVDDRLHPEWPNLRFILEGQTEAAIGDKPLVAVPPTVIVGPTSRATRFRAATGQTWGVGLLPLGWTRITEAPASDYADRFCDPLVDPAFARLRSFDDLFAPPSGDPDRLRDRIVTALRKALSPPHQRESEIVQLERALVDPAIHSVAELAEHVTTSMRTL
jgi:hypothetical protein